VKKILVFFIFAWNKPLSILKQM